MAASTDYFKKVGSPGTATTLSAPGYTAGATSITVASTTNWPTDTGVTFCMYEVTTVGTETVMTAGTYNEYDGVVTGATSIGSLSHVAGSGTDRNYAAGTGTVVTIMVTSGRENALVDGLLVQHAQDGTHTAVTATSVSTDTISEKTAANGVTVDGLNIKDGKLNTNDSVVTANITDSAVTHAKLAAGIPVQMVSTSTTALATGTTTIPLDDTIPQNTEGTEFMTLAITPKSATNILVIEVVMVGSVNATTNLIGALFQDSTANALAASTIVSLNTGNSIVLPLRHTMAAGTTSATTFKFRAGGSAASTVTFNGRDGGRLFGAITKSSIVITEYKA